MANRLDLEARLRALRADPKPATSSIVSAAPSTAVTTRASHESPRSSAPNASLVSAPYSAPQVPGKNMVSPTPSPLAPKPPKSPPHTPASSPSLPAGTSGSSSKASRRSLKRRESCGATMFGPEYDDAIRMAQHAIENERRRNIHTAIDEYIEAGQLLVRVGKKQEAVELQDILKKKALALLERAEKLSAWVSEVKARDSSVDALANALAHVQSKQDEEMNAKEAQVSKIKSQNGELMERLSQLTGIAKAKSSFRRMLAKKREEKKRKKLLEGKASALMAKTKDEQKHKIEKMEEEALGLATAMEVQARLHTELSDDMEDSNQEMAATSTPEADRESQKRQLINELHQVIGLPEISHFRSFKPLGADAWRDKRQQQLEEDLEQAKREAEMLRDAVQRMEAQLQSAEKGNSDLSEQEKVDVLNDELARVREQLALERERNEVLEKHQVVFSDSDSDGELSDAEDVDAFEDLALVMQLRQSLHAEKGHGASTGEPASYLQSGSTASPSSDVNAPALSPRKRRSTHDGGFNGMAEDEINALASPKRRQKSSSTDDGLWI